MRPRRHPSPSSRIQASQSFGDNFRHHCFLPSMDGSLRLATPGGGPGPGAVKSGESLCSGGGRGRGRLAQGLLEVGVQV